LFSSNKNIDIVTLVGIWKKDKVPQAQGMGRCIEPSMARCTTTSWIETYQGIPVSTISNEL